MLCSSAPPLTEKEVEVGVLSLCYKHFNSCDCYISVCVLLSASLVCVRAAEDDSSAHRGEREGEFVKQTLIEEGL